MTRKLFLISREIYRFGIKLFNVFLFKSSERGKKLYLNFNTMLETDKYLYRYL